MRRILWCGGSQLAQAKKNILSSYPDFLNEFAVTAAGFHRWYLAGHRIAIHNSGIVGLDRFRAINKTVYYEEDYDYCVFVGQYVQPTRYFLGDAPLSQSLIAATLHGRDFLLDLRSGHAVNEFRNNNVPEYFRNQPLEFFAKVFAGKMILLHDPLPCVYPEYLVVPADAKQQFNQSVIEFCGERGIRLILQDKATIDEYWMTKKEYQRVEGDYTHVNDMLWHITLANIFNS
jgi:hypothetical protein